MALKIDGQKLNRLIRVPDDDSLTQEENGIWRARTTFKCDWRLVFQLMPRRFQTRHPDFNNLICDKVSVEREKPSIAVITAEYAGGNDSDGSAGGDGNTENEPIIEVYGSVSQQPIQTHPDFVDVLAGTSDAPLNEAEFDDDGNFEKFGHASELLGVTDYLAPQQTVRRTTIAKTRPTSIQVSVIEIPPVGTGSFLKTVYGYRRQGAVWVVEEEWLSAGQGRAWHASVYPDP